MKKNAFTLIELLGVITLLGIIALITLPAVDSQIKRAKEKGYETQRNTIITAARNYSKDIRMNIEDNTSYTITLDDLKINGYLDFDLKNPLSDKCLSNNNIITITRNKNNYEVSVPKILDDGEKIDCNELEGYPSLVLLGANPINLHLGDTYVEPGFTATDTANKNINNTVITSGTVNTNTIGKYTLEYKVTVNNKMIIKKRTVNVIDNVKPLIIANKEIVVADNILAFNILEGVTATDNSEQPLKINAISNISLGVVGEYYVKYSAVDNSGNHTIVTSKIKVVPSSSPAPAGDNKPVLTLAMKPVIYDTTANKWKIISETDTNWYNYENQKWANAVVLANGIIKTVGNLLEPTDIDSMFVWIPRFEYKVTGFYGNNGTDSNNPGEIEINLLKSTTLKSTKGFKIHDAFKNNYNEQISGLWMSKFEISASANGIQSKPNVSSLNSVNRTTKEFYEDIIKSHDKVAGEIGITKYNTHMITNLEWGAVSYLSQSKYGKYGNSNYSKDDKEIYINNSTQVYTGRSLGSKSLPGSPTSVEGSYTYETKQGQGSSSTGNITGVYDLSGGSEELTLSVLNEPNSSIYSGLNKTNNSGFNGALTDGMPKSGAYKPSLYIPYQVTSVSLKFDYNYFLPGDALFDISKTGSNWYQDKRELPGTDTGKVWFVRGGIYSDNVKAGIFALSASTGKSTVKSTSRSIVSVAETTFTNDTSGRDFINTGGGIGGGGTDCPPNMPNCHTTDPIKPPLVTS